MAKKGLRTRKIGHGRNDLCPCGSGKKYKSCCKPIPRMKTDEELKADEERRKKSRGTTVSEFVQFVQAMARSDVIGRPVIDHGDLPERVSIDER